MMPELDPGDFADASEQPGTTAADGLDRWAFSVEEFLGMKKAGIIRPEERLELLEGDIVLAMPQDRDHENLRAALHQRLAPHLAAGLALAAEASVILSDCSLVHPDLTIFAGSPKKGIQGAEVRLIIEIATDHLAYDLGLKPKLYALRGIRELWVVDARRRNVHIHCDPFEGEWGTILRRGADHVLTHPSLPGFAAALEAL